MPKQIAYEASIIAKLRAEGWEGDAEQLRELADAGERLRQRYENECSYAWAGNSPEYRASTAAAEKRLARMAADAGLTLFIQGDCRGATVYVRDATCRISDNNYSSEAQCIRFPI